MVAPVPCRIKMRGTASGRTRQFASGRYCWPLKPPKAPRGTRPAPAPQRATPVRLGTRRVPPAPGSTRAAPGAQQGRHRMTLEDWKSGNLAVEVARFPGSQIDGLPTRRCCRRDPVGTRVADANGGPCSPPEAER